MQVISIFFIIIQSIALAWNLYILNNDKIHLSFISKLLLEKTKKEIIYTKAIKITTYVIFILFLIFTIISIILNIKTKQTNLIISSLGIGIFYIICLLKSIKDINNNLNSFFIDRQLKKEISIIRNELDLYKKKINGNYEIIKEGLIDFYNTNLCGYIRYNLKDEELEKERKKVIGLIAIIPNTFKTKNEKEDSKINRETKNLLSVQLAKEIKDMQGLLLIEDLFFEKDTKTSKDFFIKEILYIFDEEEHILSNASFLNKKNNERNQLIKILKGNKTDKVQEILDIVIHFLENNSELDISDINEIIDIYIQDERTKIDFCNLLNSSDTPYIQIPLEEYKITKEK